MSQGSKSKSPKIGRGKLAESTSSEGTAESLSTEDLWYFTEKQREILKEFFDDISQNPTETDVDDLYSRIGRQGRLGSVIPRDLVFVWFREEKKRRMVRQWERETRKEAKKLQGGDYDSMEDSFEVMEIQIQEKEERIEEPKDVTPKIRKLKKRNKAQLSDRQSQIIETHFRKSPLTDSMEDMDNLYDTLESAISPEEKISREMIEVWYEKTKKRKKSVSITEVERKEKEEKEEKGEKGEKKEKNERKRERIRKLNTRSGPMKKMTLVDEQLGSSDGQQQQQQPTFTYAAGFLSFFFSLTFCLICLMFVFKFNF